MLAKNIFSSDFLIFCTIIIVQCSPFIIKCLVAILGIDHVISESWSFLYNSFVKFHGQKIWEPQVDWYIQSLHIITKRVIKNLHCSFKMLMIDIKSSGHVCNHCLRRHNTQRIHLPAKAHHD